MLRSHLVPIALCVTSLFAVTNAAEAQRGGGGRGGGGGFGGGYGRGGYGYGRGFYGPGFGFGLGLGLGAGLYPYYYGAGPYWYDPIVVAPGYAYAAPPTVIVQGQPGQQPAAPTAPPQAAPNEPAPKNAQIKVVLPDANAKVWFDGNLTSSTGAERLYHTPDLNPSANNSYRIRAQWTENGKQVVQEVVVPVQAGRGSVADFTRAPSEKIPAPPPK